MQRADCVLGEHSAACEGCLSGYGQPPRRAGCYLSSAATDTRSMHAGWTLLSCPCAESPACPLSLPSLLRHSAAARPAGSPTTPPSAPRPACPARPAPSRSSPTRCPARPALEPTTLTRKLLAPARSARLARLLSAPAASPRASPMATQPPAVPLGACPGEPKGTAGN